MLLSSLNKSYAVKLYMCTDWPRSTTICIQHFVTSDSPGQDIGVLVLLKPKSAIPALKVAVTGRTVVG